jgi:acyl carrier protein
MPEPAQIPDRDGVLAVVRETVAKYLDVDVAEVPEDAKLLELPNVDSLKAVRGVMEIEARYGITFDPSQAVVVRTVGELADQVVATIAASRS